MVAGRGVGLGLGYQDLPQIFDQYGREQANAVLGTVMTKIFLPGLDDATAEYASKLLGDTTSFAKTFQDYQGTSRDNTRYAEQKRALMQPVEIRQIPPHAELIVVNDTAPPIRAAYPPLAVLRRKYSSPQFSESEPLYSGNIDAKFAERKKLQMPMMTARSTDSKTTFVSAYHEFRESKAHLNKMLI